MNSAVPLPLQQHMYFADALRHLGQPSFVQKMPGAAAVVTLKRFGVTFASRGPVWREQTTEEQRIESLRHSGLRLINADKEDPTLYRKAGFRLISTAAAVAELDVQVPPAERLARAKQKWRNAWRRAQDTSFTISRQPFDPDLHQWLLDVDRHQQRAKGFRTLPHALINAYAMHQPNNVMVFTAHQKRTAIAAMLFLLHPPVATYHIGWNGDTGRMLKAHHQIIFDAADWLHNKRYHRLDLGAVDTENAPDLARFKIGTGAVVRQLGGTWLRIPGL